MCKHMSVKGAHLGLGHIGPHEVWTCTSMWGHGGMNTGRFMYVRVSLDPQARVGVWGL